MKQKAIIGILAAIACILGIVMYQIEKPDSSGNQQAEESFSQSSEETSVEESSEPEPVTVDPEPTTVGTFLRKAFKDQLAENADLTAQKVVDNLLASEYIAFEGASMPVEPGVLMGFDNAEITGFSEGVMFSPMIGTLPFVGYVFVLEDGTDVESFIKTLEENANLRWNICTEAEEIVTGYVEGFDEWIMADDA